LSSVFGRSQAATPLGFAKREYLDKRKTGIACYGKTVGRIS
jgi:hypothetical protein